MRGARDLRSRGTFIFVDETECAARRLCELARVREERSFFAYRFFFRRIELRRGDLVQLIAEEIETQRAIALCVGELAELRMRALPRVVRRADCVERVPAEVVEQLPIRLSRDA